MKKLIWTLVILVVVAVFGGRAVWLYQHRRTDANAITIGAIVPLSGLMAEISDEILNSLNMAVDRLNQNSDRKISLIVEDGKYTEKDSISALHKIGMNKINGLIVLGQLPAMGIGPLIKDYNIPVMVTIAAGDKIPTFNEYIFRFYMPSKYTGRKIAQFAVNDLKINSVACLYIKNDMGKDAFKSFKETIEKFGLKLAAEEQYDMKSMDMRSQVAKVLSTNPDAIYIVGFGPGYISAINAIQEARYEGAILTGGEVLQPAYKNNIKKLDNIYLVDTIYDAYSTDEKVLKFNQMYEQKYGKKPGNFAPFNYEAMLILGKALQLPKNVDAMNYLKHSVKKHSTVFGSISFDENGEVDIPLVIKQMQPDGTAKIIKE